MLFQKFVIFLFGFRFTHNNFPIFELENIVLPTEQIDIKTARNRRQQQKEKKNVRDVNPPPNSTYSHTKKNLY